ncbi:MAG: putative transposase [Pseudonocardiales bacterium]|nr:putative transposase [Pseudonocardiales bacterium]
MSVISKTPDRMVIAVDPHKASWTAAAVDGSLQPVATLRVPVSREGYRALRSFARRWPDSTWAIEGASGLGAPLATRLRTDGIEVLDVPAKLATRVRTLSTGHGRKNDDADAISVGIAALSAPALNSAADDATVTALRAIVEHRDDLVKTRTQTVNRLHVLLTNLIPAGAGRDLSADQAAELLRGIRPRATAGKALRGLAVDLVAEIRQLDRRIIKATKDIQTAVANSGTTLTKLCGIGALTAGTILGRVGTIDRFRSAAAFATYTGAAPIDVSSGDTVRHRLSRAGDRQLNRCLHVMALTQIRQDTTGRSYYLRKRTEGKGHKEAMRCLKRRLSDVIYRQMLNDAARSGAGPGGHSGAALQSSAASSNPAC